jgi:hypothetical protein
MRLFLDAHVSGRVIARALRERGHDVRAANEEPRLDGWEDAPRSRDGRAAHHGHVQRTGLPRSVGAWGAAGKHHAGCLILVGIDHREFGLILHVVDAALAARPDQSAWRDYAAWGTRRSTA